MSGDKSPFEHGRYRYARIGGRGGRGEGDSDPEPEGGPSRRSKLVDRVIGVLLGIVLGVAIVAAFVFLGGDETIDAPRIDDPVPGREAPVQPGAGRDEGQPR